MLTQLRCSFLRNLRNRSQLFWSLLFPLVLGTFFYLAFSSINERTEGFALIPVAVVDEGNQGFTAVLDELAEGGDDALLTPTYTDAGTARSLLAGGEVDGVFFAGEEITLELDESGINQSILKHVADSYLQIYGTVERVAQTRPDMVQEVVEAVSGSAQVLTETTLAKGQLDSMIQYFFNLIAMTCLFGCYFGMYNVVHIQADQGSIAARRSVAPERKIRMICIDFAAVVCIQLVQVMIVLAYLIFVLKVDFGTQWPFVLITCLAGCIEAVAFGMFVGAVVKVRHSVKDGLLTGITLLLCFLSGLMFGNMKQVIQDTVPIVNRINPAVLLSDALYCLTVYDGYARFTRNIVSLLVLAAVMLLGSSLVLRRQRYASI